MLSATDALPEDEQEAVERFVEQLAELSGSGSPGLGQGLLCRSTGGADIVISELIATSPG
jgi:hypothetical protein